MHDWLLTYLIPAIPLTFATLFPVLNPIGSAIITLPYTTGVDSAARRWVARKVALNAFFLMTVILFAGSSVLAFFGISVPVVQMVGGLVIASIGWGLLMAKDHVDSDLASTSGPVHANLTEQTFFPFTFPILVGPGSVAVTLTLSAHTTHTELGQTLLSQLGAVIAFAGLSLTVFLSYVYTVPLLKKVGPTGTKVILRLMAFIILCIGAQISWSGLQVLLQTLHL